MQDIEEIYNNYAQIVYKYIFCLTKNKELSEDIVQETFIKGWEHYQEVKNTTAIKKWLRTICINEFRMSLRKNKNISYIENIEDLESDGNLLVSPQLLPQEELIANEEVQRLRNGCFLAMTRKLSNNQRIAFSLYMVNHEYQRIF